MGIAVFSEDASALAGWQNGHVERLIRSIRRECVDYIIGFVLDGDWTVHVCRSLAMGADVEHDASVTA